MTFQESVIFSSLYTTTKSIEILRKPSNRSKKRKCFDQYLHRLHKENSLNYENPQNPVEHKKFIIKIAADFVHSKETAFSTLKFATTKKK